MPSIFTSVLRGETDGHVVYEDDLVFALLSREAIRLGHTLVVPKVEIDYFIDLPEPHYSALFRAGKLIARALQNVTACRRVGTVIAGWDVPHVHYHLVPMVDYDDLDPHRARLFSAEENADMQHRIRVELARLGDEPGRT